MTDSAAVMRDEYESRQAIKGSYRKKPIPLNVLQWTGENTEEVEGFIGQSLERKNGYLMIPTLESPHEASIGDVIICGIEGEFYPCKLKIFQASYEEVL